MNSLNNNNKMEAKVVSFDQLPELIQNLVDHLKRQFVRNINSYHSKESWWAWKICANYLVNQNPRYIERWGIRISRISDKAIGFISTERLSKSGSIRSTIWMQSLVWSRLRRWWLPTLGVIEIADNRLRITHSVLLRRLRPYFFYYILWL